MVELKDQKKMAEFVRNELEKDGLYQILDNTIESNWYDGILVQETHEDEPKRFYVVCHNRQRTYPHPNSKRPGLNSEMSVLTRKANEQGIILADVFYKDYKTFHVRMADREKLRAGKSLKRYSLEQINDMLSLRGLENLVLAKFAEKHKKFPLVYYQPKTERLKENIREITMNPVWLDYSHLSSDEAKSEYSIDGWSERYKLPSEEQKSENSVAILVPDRNRALLKYKDLSNKAA